MRPWKTAARDRRLRRAGFTLVEMLVVIGIIALLIAFLMPALKRARLTAIRINCMNNQRQAYMAMVMYGAQFGEYPTTLSRTYVMAHWMDGTLPGLETCGFGFNDSATSGPFVLLVQQKFATYKILQCTATDVGGITLAAPRRSFQPFYPVYTSDPAFSPGLWFNYNGPCAGGGLLINYNHNNLLDRLGGSWTNWTLGEANNTWGLSYKDSKHNDMGNPYRPGWTPVSEIVFLDCISVTVGSGVWGNWSAEYEPHDDMPISCVPAFNQTGGAINMPVRRNVIFGDGHGAYVRRDDRNFLAGDRF